MNSWQCYRYINKEKAILINNGLLSVYLCCNPIYLKTLLDRQDKKNWPVVSFDTANNDEIRFHDNPNAARIELSALVGITNFARKRETI